MCDTLNLMCNNENLFQNPASLTRRNNELRHETPLAIVRWALEQIEGRAVLSTNFRPFEAAILHLCTRVQPDIPVLWVDHGYNRAATYRHAEQLKKLLDAAALKRGSGPATPAGPGPKVTDARR